MSHLSGINLFSVSVDCSDENEEHTGNVCSVPNTQITRRNPKRSNVNIDRRNEKGETKLHVACIAGKVNAVRTLLAQGCNVNAVDNAGWTPLHEACNHGFIEIVELLLENGANINHRGGAGAGGITPLYDAAQAGNFDIMELLLDHKASASVLSDQVKMLLHSVCPSCTIFLSHKCPRLFWHILWYTSYSLFNKMTNQNRLVDISRHDGHSEYSSCDNFPYTNNN